MSVALHHMSKLQHNVKNPLRRIWRAHHQLSWLHHNLRNIIRRQLWRSIVIGETRLWTSDVKIYIIDKQMICLLSSVVLQMHLLWVLIYCQMRVVLFCATCISNLGDWFAVLLSVFSLESSLMKVLLLLNFIGTALLALQLPKESLTSSFHQNDWYLIAIPAACHWPSWPILLEPI